MASKGGANESGSAGREDSGAKAPVKGVGTQAADIGHDDKPFRPTNRLVTKLFFFLWGQTSHG